MNLDNKKIILIGPVYPYKGGISHYTGQMYKALVKSHDVEMISYKMQYPKLLFKKEQRDYANDSFKIDSAKYMINTANPVNIIKTARYIKSQKPDMVIIQWWHPYFAPCYKLLQMFMGKQNLVFVCHNVFPHERFPLDKMLTKLVLAKGTHFIVHAEKEAKELSKIKENASYKVTPHPTYEMFQLQQMTKEQARKQLKMENEKKVLLFFGFVREYKGLKHLLRAMPYIMSRLENVELMVVGDFGENRQEYMDIIDELNIKDNIRLIDGYIPDQEVQQYFTASDLVVLPYESATQSGIVQIAFGLERPVIVTEVGGLPDVVDHGVTGYVVEPCNPKALAEAVIEYYINNVEEKFTESIRQQAYRFSWDRMREVIEAFIE